MATTEWGSEMIVRAEQGDLAPGPGSCPGPAPELAAEVLEVELNGTFLRREEGDGRPARWYHQVMVATPPAPPPPAGGSGPAAENLELILDVSSSLLPFHFLRTGDKLGRAVVKLLRSDGAAGTGFLVAPGILLTNHHVLPDPASAASAIALANYESAPPGATLGRPASVPLDPDSLFLANAELDFAFCGVRGLDFLGSIGLDRNSLNISAEETVNIIQHPRGRPKEVALRDNRVVKADSVVVHYVCSTEPGSSGSPVFNNQWEPVALHHASVLAEEPAARPAAGEPPGEPPGEGSARYLNEGIRISAIALWLETDEANEAGGRELSARLRGIFAGIDPQAGFFGALGRKSLGRAAPEVVAECYRNESDDLDVAFWNVRGLDSAFREQMDEVGRAVAEMGMDLWCLAHADGVCITALREHLDINFHLDYDFFHEPAGPRPSLAILYRRGKGLAVERRPWGLDQVEEAELPPLVTVRASTRRCGTVAFQLVPVAWAAAGAGAAAGAADPGSISFAEAIRRSIRRGQGEADWIVVGETALLLAPERLHVLADCDRELLAAAADRDGAVALLTGARSKVGRVFASPNLRPAFGVSEALAVARDRELPASLKALGGHQPIAFRLSLDGVPKPAPAPPLPPPHSAAGPAPAADPESPAADDLERRIRDMLAPILAKMLAEARPQPGGMS